MAPTALRSLLSKRRRASASEMDWPASTFSKMSPSSLRCKKKFIAILPQAKSAREDNFRHRHHEKHRTDERVEPEESSVNPVQAAALRQPMFQQQAQQDDQQADQICHTKLREQ